MKFSILPGLLLTPAYAYSFYDVPPTTEIHHAIVRRASGTSSISAFPSNTGTGMTQDLSTSSSATGTVVSYPTSMITATLGITAVNQISAGMSMEMSKPAAVTYSTGYPARVSGAPPLPPLFQMNSTAWPPLGKIPPTDSPQVQEWLKELDGWRIPSLNLTSGGDCSASPDQAADAQARGWLTCGGPTRDSDITICPNKLDWGLSFDDGPSQYTQDLLNYLEQKNILATFFVIGTYCAQNPDILREEYMAGHEISVHTWSHPFLTALTNEQIVAELGWTREIITQITGVTPVTMRAPYSDLDDRVRAISLAMGLAPIQWTGTSQDDSFDTRDWEVAPGLLSAVQQVNLFQSILNKASAMGTGFISLQSDSTQQSVDLAVVSNLDLALNHRPAFSLKPIGTCQGWPPEYMYRQTTPNVTTSVET